MKFELISWGLIWNWSAGSVNNHARILCVVDCFWEQAYKCHGLKFNGYVSRWELIYGDRTSSLSKWMTHKRRTHANGKCVWKILHANSMDGFAIIKEEICNFYFKSNLEKGNWEVVNRLSHLLLLTLSDLETEKSFFLSKILVDINFPDFWKVDCLPILS